MQRGDFLSPEQKQVKQLIMERLMDCLPYILERHPNIEFDGQEMADLVVAIIIMFTRESLTRLFLFSNALDKRNEIMDTIFKTIKKEVNFQIEGNISHNKTH